MVGQQNNVPHWVRYSGRGQSDHNFARARVQWMTSLMIGQPSASLLCRNSGLGQSGRTGADVNAICPQGRTPLDPVIGKQGPGRMEAYLRDHGASTAIDGKSKRSETAVPVVPGRAGVFPERSTAAPVASRWESVDTPSPQLSVRGDKSETTGILTPVMADIPPSLSVAFYTIQWKRNRRRAVVDFQWVFQLDQDHHRYGHPVTLSIPIRFTLPSIIVSSIHLVWNNDPICP